MPLRSGGWAIVLITMVGLFLRLFELSAHSLLLDEAFVAVGARDIVWNHTPMWDAISNAPFVWTISRMLAWFGDSAFLLRLPGALFGAATVPLVYLLASRLLKEKRWALLASLIFAVHPFAIAFSRVLFADVYQVFFIVAGWYLIDLLAVNEEWEIESRTWRWIALFLVWSLAFLMKYNAIVPGGLWLLAGLLWDRYSFRKVIACGAVMLGASIVSVLIWPYDSPVWLLAFLEKGGSYDVAYSASYYFTKLHLVLYGASEAAIVAGLILGVRLKRERLQSERGGIFGQLAIFLVLYLVTITFLGRAFERYLLVTVPIAAMLAAALLQEMWHAWRARRTRSVQVLAGVTAAATLLFAGGAVMSGVHYVQYLDNDVDLPSLAQQTLSEEQGVHRGYWLLSEPIGAYYLGFSQYYSRALRSGLSGPAAALNYFEWQPVPYAEERSTYTVLLVRRMLREWGFVRALTHVAAFRQEAERMEQQAHGVPPPNAIDYLTSDSVRSGDALVIVGGFRDVAGEPIVEDIAGEPGPPSIAALPLSRFDVRRVYTARDAMHGRPMRSPSDTAIDPIRAAAWLLVKK